MIKPYLITYDLNKKDKDYASLYDAIKDCSTGAWAHILDSTWLVKSNLTVQQINEKIKGVTDSNDNIFIVELTNNYYGYLDKDMWPYLKDHIFS